MWSCLRVTLPLVAACLLAQAGRADETIKSADGKLTLTVAEDGTVTAKDKGGKQVWSFPPKDVKKAKNHKTAFAPKGLARLVFVAYGKKLYALEAAGGKYLWTHAFDAEDDDKVTFAFEKGEVVLDVAGKKSRFDMRTGKKQP
jgi:outer membrane protein assembly factor BamB